MTNGATRAVGLVFLSILAVGASRVQVATISGTVSDLDGGWLPGATITARATGEVRRAVVNADGRFRLDGLSAGAYHVTADLPGFQRSAAEVVVVTTGRATACNFAMRVGNTTQVTHRLLAAGLPAVLRAADVVVHVRIASVVGAGVIAPPQRYLTTEHVAVVLSTLKEAGPASARTGTIHFWQVQAGAWAENGRRYGGEEPPYSPGDEFIGLFTRDRNGRLVELAGGYFMFRVMNEKVSWPRAPSLGVQDAMSVDAFIAVLRGALAGKSA
jgi:hypothetical protein